MKIWTVANQKGGVGKTTTTVGLGGLLAAWGFRTLVVDIDPQGSLTNYFRYDPDQITSGTYSLFQAAADQTEINPADLLHDTGAEGLKLLPATVALATLDRQAGRMDGMGLVLSNALEKLSNQFDYVIIDCPPMLGVLMVNALAACQRLVVPVQTEFLALKGLERMLRTLRMVLKARSTLLPYTIVPTMFDRRTRASIDSLKVLRETYPENIWHEVIPVDTQFREASKAGVTPAQHDPRGRGVKAYSELLETLQDQEKQLAQTGGVG